MSSQPLRQSKPSLIERAAKVYDFEALVRMPAVPQEQNRPITAPEPPVAADPISPLSDPTSPEAHRVLDRTALAEAGLIVPDGPASGLAEEFRIIKRQILLAAFGGKGQEPLDNGRKILVCSAEPNEGKTFFAVNLALSMATDKDIEVLLVDADLAKPEVLPTLGIEGGAGLVDAILDPTIDIETLILRTDLPNLSVMPSGRATNEANELLASERAKAVLDRLSDKRDRVVIFDSSPVLAASTASVLAYHVGQAAFVVRAEVTGEATLRDALGLLAGCEHVRLVLNGVSFIPHGRRFGAYYGYGG